MPNLQVSTSSRSARKDATLSDSETARLLTPKGHHILDHNRKERENLPSGNTWSNVLAFGSAFLILFGILLWDLQKTQRMSNVIHNDHQTLWVKLNDSLLHKWYNDYDLCLLKNSDSINNITGLPRTDYMNCTRYLPAAPAMKNKMLVTSRLFCNVGSSLGKACPAPLNSRKYFRYELRDPRFQNNPANNNNFITALKQLAKEKIMLLFIGDGLSKQNFDALICEVNRIMYQSYRNPSNEFQIVIPPQYVNHNDYFTNNINEFTIQFKIPEINSKGKSTIVTYPLTVRYLKMSELFPEEQGKGSSLFNFDFDYFHKIGADYFQVFRHRRKLNRSTSNFSQDPNDPSVPVHSRHRHHLHEFEENNNEKSQRRRHRHRRRFLEEELQELPISAVKKNTEFKNIAETFKNKPTAKKILSKQVPSKTNSKNSTSFNGTRNNFNSSDSSKQKYHRVIFSQNQTLVKPILKSGNSKGISANSRGNSSSSSSSSFISSKQQKNKDSTRSNSSIPSSFATYRPTYRPTTQPTIAYQYYNHSLSFTELKELVDDFIFPNASKIVPPTPSKSTPKPITYNGVYVIANIGVFYNSREKFRYDLKTFLDWLNELGNDPKHKNQVFYRETTAQHWNHTENGYYDTSYRLEQENNGTCVPLADNTPELDWRNVDLYTIIQQERFKSIKVIPFHKLTMPLHNMHPSNAKIQDCTHYCYLPQMWQPIWYEITHAAKKMFDKKR